MLKMQCMGVRPEVKEVKEKVAKVNQSLYNRD